MSELEREVEVLRAEKAQLTERLRYANEQLSAKEARLWALREVLDRLIEKLVER